MTGLDVAIVAAWLVFSAVVGLIATRRASRSTDEYFLAGRSLPWWLLGTSMVATTFAADTPLVVAAWVAKTGVDENWKWWFTGVAASLTPFLFAPLWRRSGVMTEGELAELRYGGRAARWLRAGKALGFGLGLNVLTLAWVMQAMRTVVETAFGLPPEATWGGLPAGAVVVFGLFALTTLYTGGGGLWGVVLTDLFQFALAMTGSVAMAWFAWRGVGGLEGLRAGLEAHGLSLEQRITLLPLSDPRPDGRTAQLLVLLTVTWWAARNVDGGSYLAQRMLAARDERHAAWGYLWFAFANLVLRSWPWIVVGLCGLATFGPAGAKEDLYPRMMVEVLPPGWFGLLLASFLAAFMSTCDTQLNWGASLLVNDLYRRFLVTGKADQHYLRASRVTVLGLAALGALASTQVDALSGAWELALAATAGLGTVYVARWFWWRVTAWAELAAMGAALLGTGLLRLLAAYHPANVEPGWSLLADLPAGWLRFPFDAVGVLLVVLPTWLAVARWGPPNPPEVLLAFYRQVRPGGPGWRRVAGDEAGFALDHPARRWAGGLGSLIGIFAGLAAVGHLLFGQTALGAFEALLSAVGLAVAARVIHLQAQGTR